MSDDGFRLIICHVDLIELPEAFSKRLDTLERMIMKPFRSAQVSSNDSNLLLPSIHREVPVNFTMSVQIIMGYIQKVEDWRVYT